MSNSNNYKDERVILIQNELFNLLGVKDDDTRYADVLIVSRYVVDKESQAQQELLDSIRGEAQEGYLLPSDNYIKKDKLSELSLMVVPLTSIDNIAKEKGLQ